MGMGYASISGYVIKVNDLTDKIDLYSKIDSSIYNLYYNGKLEEIVSNLLGVEVEIFEYESEKGDRYDDLEDGLYILIDEDNLFERKETELMTLLKQKGLEPQFSRWVHFG